MTPDICPYCQKSLHVGIQPAGRRICSLCGGKIGKRHKYRIGSDGRLVHKSCTNPTGQIETNNAKGMFD
jgi:hypothetical protein